MNSENSRPGRASHRFPWPDNGLRHNQIIDALLRSAAVGGLRPVTMRSVAAEAGVSLRVLEAIVLEAVPDDEESRTFHLLYTTYAVLSVTDPALAAQPFMAAPDAMAQFVAVQVRTAQQAGLIEASVHPVHEPLCRCRCPQGSD